MDILKFFQENLILLTGFLLFLGYFSKRISARLKMPDVTGFVLLGVFLGISIIKLLNHETLKELSFLSTIALGIIAFLIGIELKGDVIRKLGKAIIIIACMEGFGAFLVVAIGLMVFLRIPAYRAILMGAVAAATAPAATVAVIRQYKAKGPLTSTILAVVGIDDAIALIIYVFASAFVKGMLKGTHISFIHTFFFACGSVFLSAIIGLIAVFIYAYLLKNTRANEYIEFLIAAFILIILGVCEELKISELLAIMVFGAGLANISPRLAKKSENIIANFSPIFMFYFFVLGGAHLNIFYIKEIGFLGIMYFIFRSIGKIVGSSIGAIIGKAPNVVKKFIGFSLLPQVGVALALAIAIQKDFGNGAYGEKGIETAKIIINVLLFTTIITEIVGPVLTKFALRKAKEIK